MAIIGKINDEVLIDDVVLRKPETFTHWVDPTIEEKDKEIERLNNIINELEKYMRYERINDGQIDEWTIMEIQMKLKELKEGK